MRQSGEQGCCHFTVVVGPNCRVEQCEHGTVHVSLGDMTLRLRPESFQALATALGVAAGRIETTEPASATRLLC